MFGCCRADPRRKKIQAYPFAELVAQDSRGGDREERRLG